MKKPTAEQELYTKAWALVCATGEEEGCEYTMPELGQRGIPNLAIEYAAIKVAEALDTIEKANTVPMPFGAPDDANDDPTISYEVRDAIRSIRASLIKAELTPKDSDWEEEHTLGVMIDEIHGATYMKSKKDELKPQS